MEAHALDFYVLYLHGAFFLNPVEERPRVNSARDAVDFDEEGRHLELLGVLEGDRADRERELRPAVVDADPPDVEILRGTTLRLYGVR